MTVIRECVNPECAFRYPDHVSNHEKEYCPKCGQPALIREKLPENALYPLTDETLSFQAMQVVLDNIRSIYNVGSIFRSADGFGVSQIHLCGITPTPQHPRFTKTSLGAEKHVAWRYHLNALKACGELKSDGIHLVALENSVNASNLYAIDGKLLTNRFALIVGNEVSGVDPQLLRLCDTVVAIPMAGYKHSFNVAAAFGVAVSYLYSLSRPERNS